MYVQAWTLAFNFGAVRHYAERVTVHCSLFIIHCSLFIVHCSLFTVFNPVLQHFIINRHWSLQSV